MLNINGFKINYTHPNLLIITWFKKEEPKQSVLFNGTKTNVKSINDYKPSGNLIYNSNFLKDIYKKKNYLLN